MCHICTCIQPVATFLQCKDHKCAFNSQISGGLYPGSIPKSIISWGKASWQQTWSKPTHPQKLYTNSHPQPKNIETHKNSLNFILSTPFLFKNPRLKKKTQNVQWFLFQQPPTPPKHSLEKPPPFPPSVRPMMVKIPASSESWKNSKGIVIKSYQEPQPAAWKTVVRPVFLCGKKWRAPKRSQRAGHKKIKTEEVEVLSEETKNKLSQNWLLVKKLVTKLVIAHGFWNFTVLHG